MKDLFITYNAAAFVCGVFVYKIFVYKVHICMYAKVFIKATLKVFITGNGDVHGV